MKRVRRKALKDGGREEKGRKGEDSWKKAGVEFWSLSR